MHSAGRAPTFRRVKRGRSSRTASFVTFVRALAHDGFTDVRGFSDPTARELLDDKARARLEKAERRLRSGGARSGRQRLLQKAVDLLALRTLVIDEAVERELRRGTRQLVLLGAGLDGRAWRLPGLAESRAFEVDHPDTQAAKRARLGALKPSAARVDFVPVDFERDSLGDSLARAGHESGAPTVWVWEGVVMYLTLGAVRATLQAIAARSARGSVLVVYYHTEKHRGLAALLLRLVGEPNRSSFSPAELARELASVGFAVEMDERAVEWSARFGGSVRDKGTARIARIAVARRS